MEESHQSKGDQAIPTPLVFDDDAGIDIYIAGRTHTAPDHVRSTTASGKEYSTPASKTAVDENSDHKAPPIPQSSYLDKSTAEIKYEQSISTSFITVAKMPNSDYLVAIEPRKDSTHQVDNHVCPSSNLIGRCNNLNADSSPALCTKRNFTGNNMSEPQGTLLQGGFQMEQSLSKSGEAIRLTDGNIYNIMGSNISHNLLHKYQRYNSMKREMSAYQHLEKLHFYEWERQRKVFMNFRASQYYLQQQQKTDSFSKGENSLNRSALSGNLPPNTSNFDPFKKALIDKPRDDDVLYGRGFTFLHPGNRRYYDRIGELREAYRSSSASFQDRTQIAYWILHWVQDDCNGRFLLRDPQAIYQWYEVPDSKAIKKIRQGLREHMYPHERSRWKQEISKESKKSI